MKSYKKWINRTAYVMVGLFMPVLVLAQPNPGCDPAIDPTCVPIDGGLSLLIGAGIVYGIKKVKDQIK